ncbi:MAG: SCO family protein [Ignavibacteriaceae bacterium]|nr:SCO family protein [Chlorobium sp.]MCW8823634.1 SCO family protein [Ignavibacteriaceae bacterium]MCW9065060.1 SCO family protein [Ignavibacteriaceae bacterium]
MKRLLLTTVLGLLLISTSLPDDKIEIGIDEQLGKHIPLDAVFNDEDGNQVKLGDLITEPTVLALVYYHCPGICNPLMFELANVMNKSDLEPGYDYNVISISIDDLETPQKASEKKKEMMSSFDKDVPQNSWRFLTGNKENIRKVSDAAGYYFKREGTEFRHSGALIFIDKTGKICRYLIPSYTENHGFGILPFDFKMAVLETSKGKETPTIARVLQLCFSYDPQGKTYALNFTRIFGVAILLFAGIFFLVIKLKPKKKK